MATSYLCYQLDLPLGPQTPKQKLSMICSAPQVSVNSSVWGSGQPFPSSSKFILRGLSRRQQEEKVKSSNLGSFTHKLHVLSFGKSLSPSEHHGAHPFPSLKQSFWQSVSKYFTYKKRSGQTDVCVPDEYSGKGVCASGHCRNEKKRCFYLTGIKVGCFLFCFKHGNRLSGFRSLGVVQFPEFLAQGDEDDQIVIREAGEQSHLSLSSALGRQECGQGVCVW